MPINSIYDALLWYFKNVSDVWSLLGTVRLSQLRILLLMALLNILKLNSEPSYLRLIAFSSHWADVGDDTSETFLYDHIIGHLILILAALSSGQCREIFIWD